MITASVIKGLIKYKQVEGNTTVVNDQYDSNFECNSLEDDEDGI